MRRILLPSLALLTACGFGEIEPTYAVIAQRLGCERSGSVPSGSRVRYAIGSEVEVTVDDNCPRVLDFKSCEPRRADTIDISGTGWSPRTGAGFRADSPGVATLRFLEDDDAFAFVELEAVEVARLSVDVVAGRVLSDGSIEVAPNDTADLRFALLDAEGREIQGAVEFSTSDPDIFIVPVMGACSSERTLFARNVGRATLTAKHGDLYVRIPVIVPGA